MKASKRNNPDVFSPLTTRKATKSALVLQARMEPKQTRARGARSLPVTSAIPSAVSAPSKTLTGANAQPTLVTSTMPPHITQPTPLARLLPISDQPADVVNPKVRTHTLLHIGDRGQEMWGYVDSDTSLNGGDDPERISVSDPSPDEEEASDDDDLYVEEPLVQFVGPAPVATSAAGSITPVGETPLQQNGAGRRKGRKVTAPTTAPPAIDEGIILPLLCDTLFTLSSFHHPFLDCIWCRKTPNKYCSSEQCILPRNAYCHCKRAWNWSFGIGALLHLQLCSDSQDISKIDKYRPLGNTGI